MQIQSALRIRGFPICGDEGQQCCATVLEGPEAPWLLVPAGDPGTGPPRIPREEGPSGRKVQQRSDFTV